MQRQGAIVHHRHSLCRYQKDFRTQKDRQYDSQSWSAWDEAEETETVSLRDQVIGEIVYGVAPVLAVLKAKRYFGKIMLQVEISQDNVYFIICCLKSMD